MPSKLVEDTWRRNRRAWLPPADLARQLRRLRLGLPAEPCGWRKALPWRKRHPWRRPVTRGYSLRVYLEGLKYRPAMNATGPKGTD